MAVPKYDEMYAEFLNGWYLIFWKKWVTAFRNWN